MVGFDHRTSGCCNVGKKNTFMAGVYPRAAAFEAKYCEVDDFGEPLWMYVMVAAGGVHQGNRGFVYTQGKRVVDLGTQILTDGCCKDEANQRGVAMRERPLKEQV